MGEVHKTFSIEIILIDGSSLVTPQYATTKWHAIDKAFTKFRNVQPDRTKYSRKTKSLCSH